MSYWGAYLRLRVPVWASNVDVLRAVRRRFRRDVRWGLTHKDDRKQVYRDILECHAAAVALAS